jgi:hypothetical protein
MSFQTRPAPLTDTLADNSANNHHVAVADGGGGGGGGVWSRERLSVAASAVCDFAVLRGSFDDLSVTAVELRVIDDASGWCDDDEGFSPCLMQSAHSSLSVTSSLSVPLLNDQHSLDCDVYLAWDVRRSRWRWRRQADEERSAERVNREAPISDKVLKIVQAVGEYVKRRKEDADGGDMVCVDVTSDKVEFED